MKHIDETRLENDLGYRFNFLAEFIGFGADDVKVIHGAAPLLAPKVSGLVDAYMTSCTAMIAPGGTSCHVRRATRARCH